MARGSACNFHIAPSWGKTSTYYKLCDEVSHLRETRCFIRILIEYQCTECFHVPECEHYVFYRDHFSSALIGISQVLLLPHLRVREEAEQMPCCGPYSCSAVAGKCEDKLPNPALHVCPKSLHWKKPNRNTSLLTQFFLQCHTAALAQDPGSVPVTHIAPTTTGNSTSRSLDVLSSL